MTPVRVGLVGCGRLAERGYLPALALAEGVELVALADAEPARCATLAPALPAFAGLAALLAGAEIDLAVLAHPASLHVEDARRAAAAGVSSLVEKPPARTAPEALPLLGLDPPAWMGFNRRFEPETAAARAELAARPAAVLELGMSILPRSWGAHGGSEGVLLDLGPHLVDLSTWLTGREVERVRVESASPGEAVFELDLGETRARISVSHGSAWHELATARDAAGRGVTLFERGGFARRLAARLRPGAGPLVGSLAAQLSAAARAVRGEADARLADAAAGVGVLRVLDAVAGSTGRDWIVP
jgi:predicted dehydrogenase